MSDLDQTFRIGSLATTNIFFDVKLKMTQVSSQEPSMSSMPKTYALSAKSFPILIKLSGWAP